MHQISIDDQIRLLSRRCERIISEAELKAKLEKSARTGKPLRVKLGMDPTAPDVTLGHCVPLKVVRQFQDLGHKAVLIIGDYTARVGDPTGRNQTRKVLSGQEIDANAKTYVAQVGKILRTDPEHLEVRYNGEWLGKMGLVDIIRLAARKSVAQVLAREDFAKRYAEGVDIRLHEILYPLLQGWDSVVIDADIEMGGSDQLFNNLVGREFQKEEGKEGQCVFVTPLLVGTDGVKKMSKSLGNYVGVTDPPGGPEGMFGKIMSLPDGLMESYYRLLTDVPEEDYRTMIAERPRDAKVRLARIIIEWLHDKGSADRAEADFKAATHGGVPSDIPHYPVSVGKDGIVPVLIGTGIVQSSSEAHRKIREGAVRLNGNKITDPKLRLGLKEPAVLQMGSKKFVRLIPAE
ncbi:MAG: tyrosine--tRNA ligase [Phycisphaerae bacterium]|mgnify:CR=1 FL=1|jgi:tyrosyl-tRNA synthetase|nr:MAG: tyrosine--tRNA ligase [Phycisphaerae bacterium]